MVSSDLNLRNCGLNKLGKSHINTRIRDGINASVGEFPWIASLQSCYHQYCRHVCGAAHCLQHINRTKEKRYIRVHLGTNHKNRFNYNISETFVNNCYAHKRIGVYDIALLKVNNSTQFLAWISTQITRKSTTAQIVNKWYQLLSNIAKISY